MERSAGWASGTLPIAPEHVWSVLQLAFLLEVSLSPEFSFLVCSFSPKSCALETILLCTPRGLSGVMGAACGIAPLTAAWWQINIAGMCWEILKPIFWREKKLLSYQNALLHEEGSNKYMRMTEFVSTRKVSLLGIKRDRSGC